VGARGKVLPYFWGLYLFLFAAGVAFSIRIPLAAENKGDLVRVIDGRRYDTGEEVAALFVLVFRLSGYCP
jgi:hypothetical protein